MRSGGPQPCADRSGAETIELRGTAVPRIHKKDIHLDVLLCISEHETGIEPATPSLARRCSTAEPLVHMCCEQNV